MIAGTTVVVVGVVIIMAVPGTAAHITAIIPPAFTGKIVHTMIITGITIGKKAITVTGKNITANHTAIKRMPIPTDTGRRTTCGPTVDARTVPIASIPGAEAKWAGVI
jgi:hypothetical protein